MGHCVTLCSVMPHMSVCCFLSMGLPYLGLSSVRADRTSLYRKKNSRNLSLSRNVLFAEPTECDSNNNKHGDK